MVQSLLAAVITIPALAGIVWAADPPGGQRLPLPNQPTGRLLQGVSNRTSVLAAFGPGYATYGGVVPLYGVTPILVYDPAWGWVYSPPVVPYPAPVIRPVIVNPPPPEASIPPPAAEPPPAPIRPAPRLKDDLDLKVESQRLIRQGNDSFAAGDYHQALRRYEQAIDAAPLEPMSLFHLAQAYLALGRYSDAIVAIQKGMRGHADWPRADFKPRTLYRDHPAEYDRHQAQLATLLEKNLNDDSLLFLLGYQLWFDGHKDEARVLFERAATLTLHRTFIEKFLQP